MECRTKKEDDGYYHPATEDEIICLVKKAYDELEREGLIRTERGRGTFVAATAQPLDPESQRERLRELAGVPSR